MPAREQRPHSEDDQSARERRDRALGDHLPEDEPGKARVDLPGARSRAHRDRLDAAGERRPDDDACRRDNTHGERGREGADERELAHASRRQHPRRRLSCEREQELPVEERIREAQLGPRLCVDPGPKAESQHREGDETGDADEEPDSPRLERWPLQRTHPQASTGLEEGPRCVSDLACLRRSHAASGKSHNATSRIRIAGSWRSTSSQASSTSCQSQTGPTHAASEAGA